ncbi:interleukin-21 receptor [Python bivittatus]|uniref:Interleukin-21 receptor n=1 Tax=Python bivittatus TaxID=176946 RepID=A0A9F5JB04_PYTBI|nr:interleukin-21 receptor [Python bivittatus]XP_025031258.1 interleukin-21 receptor [Python bivittatus]XP_025031259.1 interleukin-21 receptor [Python bivittatus]XP_025031260.1 interleukin-21 receptor [Python bivittatus]
MLLCQTAVLLLLLQYTSACQDLTCFADYIQTLECTWGDGVSLAERALYNLTANWDCGEGGSCSFNLTSSNATHAHYSCFSEQKLCFGNNIFDVSVTMTTLVDEPSHLLQGCKKTFLFQNHIKPCPPIHLAATVSLTGYNISWETRYLEQEYNFLDGNLQYELRYKKKGHPWQGQSQKSLLQDLRSLWLLPQEFEENTEYEFQVRSKPGEQSSYQGTWSDWSTQAALKTMYKASEHGGVQWPEVLLLVFSLIAVLMAFLGWHQRLWKKLDCFTPSPAPFFQSLYLSHNGDFKKWVGTPCSGATLDAFDWGVVVPETFGIGHKHLLLSCAKGDWTDGQNLQPPVSVPLLPECLQAVAKDCSATWEQGYGHLSIGTVTVSEEFANCCPRCSSASPCCALEELQEEMETSERDAYRGLQLGGSSSSSSSHGLVSGHLLPGNEIPPPDSFPSGLAPWASNPPFGCPLRAAEGFFGPLPATSLLSACLSAPAEEGLFCRGPLSPDWDGESDPVNGLDLDTIDSGFADCDCRSSGEGELGEMPAGCSCQSEPNTADGEPEREVFLLPRYVKQWI